ncbi:MAG: hypothetical protein ACI845_001511 [Gammaproteobacteria bacterium]
MLKNLSRFSWLKISAFIVSLTFVVATSELWASDKDGLIQWQDWSSTLFKQAKAENRMVILDLEAVWCHWCHVMEEKTYQNAEVAKMINQHYMPVRVDADANPNIASRYGRWGWPATIVFNADGEEIVKRRGYIPAIGMISMLEAIVADPGPGPSVWSETEASPSNNATLSKDLREKLQDVFFRLYDAEFGGWGNIHKFVNAPATEYVIEQARLGKRDHALMARLTLHHGQKLIYPEWGGVYQYSDQLDWPSPHFEKIMFYQAENLRLYSLAYARWKRSEYLEAIKNIHGYLQNFLLAPDGGFYTSQDADLNLEVDDHAFFVLSDQKRRSLGMPKIDTNIYSPENGWMINALLAMYVALGSEIALDQAKASAQFIIDNRSIGNGGFFHGATDTSGPFLGDNQAMARAFIALYQNTSERRWLDKAKETLEFIEVNFRNADGGYNSAAVEPSQEGVFASPIKQIDEIAALARTSNLAWHYTDTPELRKMAEHAMRYLAAEELSEQFFFQPSILLSDYELNIAPVHITVVGSKSDKAAIKLFAEARQYASSYLRVDWWDKSAGPLPNANVTYPEMEQAAAFVCSDNACSLPLFDGDAISDTVDELYLK